MNRRRAIGLLAGTLAALLAAGCGRKGDPELPDGRKDSYPRKYPPEPQPK